VQDWNPAKNGKGATDSNLMRQLAGHVKNWFEDNNLALHSGLEVAIESLAELADQSIDNAKSTVGMLRQFANSLKFIDTFKVIPKQNMALEVEIRCKEEQDVIVRQALAPLIELHALHFGKRVNFEAMVNKPEKALQLDIHEGMSLKILAPLIGIQSVPIKGSALLKRETSGELTLVATTKVPGIESPITVTVPIKTFIDGVQRYRKMTGKDETSTR